MTSRCLLVTFGVAGVLILALGSCGSDANSSQPGRVCNTPGCDDGGGTDVDADTVVKDVANPEVDAGQDAGPHELLALCGTACSGTDKEALYPGDTDPCESANGEGGAAPELGCIVVRNDKDEPEGSCSPSGSGKTGDPCVGASDCAVGHACVGRDNAGECRPYCCSDAKLCGAGTFCSAQPLLEDLSEKQTELLVPVCIVGNNCHLDEPFPCPEDEACHCADGLACTVVLDGTTGCVPPGKGTEGEPCPCAAASTSSLGFVCSQASQRCKQICSVGAGGCGEGSRCQASSELPDGFGVCTTSYEPDAG